MKITLIAFFFVLSSCSGLKPVKYSELNSHEKMIYDAQVKDQLDKCFRSYGASSCLPAAPITILP